MNPDLPSGDDGMPLQYMTVGLDPNMVRINASFDMGLGTLAGVFGRNGTGKGTLSDASAGPPTVHQERG